MTGRARGPCSCRDCGLPIVFAATESGRRKVALDLSPDPDGVVERVGPLRLARFLSRDEAKAARAAGRLLFTPHRSSCLAHKPHNPAPLGLPIF